MHRVRMPLYLPALIFLGLSSAWLWPLDGQTAQPTATVFEGARLITGDGSSPIENSAFIVGGDKFTQVGRRGGLRIPAGAAHVDLTGKTVMPALIDVQGLLHARESDRPSGAPRVQRRGRNRRHWRPRGPFRSAWRKNELGRRSLAGPQRSHPQCSAVSDGWHGDRLARIGTPGRPFEG